MIAPVLVFCYNRKEHAKKTLEALEKNTLAKETEVFIFCDGARNESDEKKVGEVKQYLLEYEKHHPYRSLTVEFSEKNKGLACSIIEGVTSVICRYKRVIVLEDDIVTSPDFLSYMNESLNYYEKDDTIWSVTGYTLPLKCLADYEQDVYLSYRASSWGWGTWSDRWDTVDWDVKDFDALCKDRKRIHQLNRGGRDMFRMLQGQRKGINNSWAIRWCYSQSMQNKFTIYPKYPKVINIGGDGSGENSLASGKYDNTLSTQKIRLANVSINHKITKEFRKYYSLSIEEIFILGCNRIRREWKKLRGTK